jgi:poly-gamma-glutamate synthase PgsB/CapB
VHDLLAPLARATPVGGHSLLVGSALDALAEEDLGRVLSVLAREDFGLALDRVKRGVVLYRGEARTFAAWRVLFEMRNPAPSKRQAFVHTWAKSPAGALRAPPGRLAELTATRVPGERVLVDAAGGWGPHLPLVDDALSCGVLSAKKISLVTASGTTTIAAAARFFPRVRAWWALTLGYARFAELRRRSLSSPEAKTQAAYVEALGKAGFSVRFVPYAYGRSGSALPTPRGLPRSGTSRAGGAHGPSDGPGPKPPSVPAALALTLPSALADGWQDLVQYATSPGGNRLPHLTAYALVALFGLLARGVLVRRAIDKDRAAIPLVVGGWGTRGKSGTERLKAALFQGLGHECLVKTTGCEAMFIHAIPGLPAREIFLYRPYDKATVWEQRDVLSIARRAGAKVFLWECMALQPDLVNLLQAQWMRDDYSTITNAYPDHEDVQGPTGYDVATVISEFVPTKGRLFTSEDQMLPILRERATERDTLLREVTARDAELVAGDILARFPYQEHPKNIALVVSLARALGVPSAVALAEMADHVVPDLGVLKTYPEVPYRGRRLSFTNGMSANERTGALSNWRRTGFAEHTVDGDPARWVVSVVNNRADRIARSEVFARFLVEDIGAHRHVIIGTNVGGILGFIGEALERQLARTRPSEGLSGDAEAQKKTALARIDEAFTRLKVGARTAASVNAELAAFGLAPFDDARAAALLAVDAPNEAGDAPYASATAALAREALDDVDEAARPFVRRAFATRRAVLALERLTAAYLAKEPARVDRAYAEVYRGIFEASLVPLHDANLTGDAILTRIADACPPGARITIHGVQNIKGTGLDFVYRWVSIGTVHAELERLEHTDPARRAEAVRALASHGDWGIVDAELALATVRARAASDPAGAEIGYEALATRLTATVRERAARITAGPAKKKSAGEHVRAVVGTTFDSVDAMKRRALAKRVLDALLAGHISHATAAIRMRAILARSKGGWMRAPR